MKNESKYCGVNILLLMIGSAAMPTSMVMPYWRGKGEAHEGLFEKCSSSSCMIIPFFQPADIEVYRLLMVFGVGLLSVATFLSMISVCIDKNVNFALGTIHLSATVACTTSIILYTVHHTKSNETLHYQWLWCYFLSWIGCSVTALALCLFVVRNVTKANDYQERTVFV